MSEPEHGAWTNGKNPDLKPVVKSAPKPVKGKKKGSK